MPWAKRARSASQPRASVTAAADPCNRGWLSGRRGPSKKSRRADDDGTPLTDELILFVFATFLEITDLVRCAATCRRWRRLVSGEAAFICRGLQRPGPGGKFLPPLAVGFFQQHDAAAPRFVPTVSASRRFPVLQERSLSLRTLVDDGLFDSSCIVTSRNGLLIVDLRGGRHNRALRLCVCNPMTGQVLTADDYQVKNSDTNTQRPSSSHYRLLMVYRRRGFTAFRSYSSEDGGGWSPEGKVTGAQLGRKQMRLTRGGVVACGGRASYWVASNVVFGLRLVTLEATVASLPRPGGCAFTDIENTFLGMAPEGWLCAIQVGRSLRASTRGKWVPTIEIRVFTYNSHDGVDNCMLQLGQSLWEMKNNIQVDQSLPDDAVGTKVKLLPHEKAVNLLPASLRKKVKVQWFCEKSGFVFFTAGNLFGDGRSEMYALSLCTRTVEKVATGAGDRLWGNLMGTRWIRWHT